MGCQATRADPDVLIWEAVKPDGHRYYKMLLIYVDDILAISHQPQQTMSQIQELYCLKDDSIGPPKGYPGANIACLQLPDGSKDWSTSACASVKTAVWNFEEVLGQDPMPSKLIDLKWTSHLSLILHL